MPEEFRNPKALKLAFQHYLHQMRLDWRSMVPGFLLPSLGSVLVFYIPPLIIARVLYHFGQANNHPAVSTLVPYVLLFMLVWGLGEVTWRIGMHFIIGAETRGSQRLFNQAMRFMFEKDLGFFHDNFAGSLTKRVSDYGWRYIDFIDTLMFNVFASYVPIIFAVVVLWFISPWLDLVLIGMLLLNGFLVFPLIKRRMKIVDLRGRAHNAVSGHIADSLANIDTVKAFANEDLEQATHEKLVADLTYKAKWSWDYQNLKIETTTSPFYVLTNTIGLLLALTVAHGNTSTLEAVFVTFSYFSTTTRVVWQFSDTYRRIEMALVDAGQFADLLLEPPRLVDAPAPKPFEIKGGEIEMRDVTFRYYDSSDQHLFKHFNLKIKSGEKVALVGHSGGGKTTVTRLLMRFMDIDDGQILIDGQDISEVRQKDLRSKIAYVPQEPAMFHRSLTDNIRYGRLKASQKEVVKAAKAAHADEFISKLGLGYDTLVGERGVKLSGGQRQRIAIARALLKNAPILILDEATSALDSESEKLIQKALWKLMEGRTAIAIAHRLSTIQRMDRIVVLEEGQVVEQGSHKELLAAKGVYARLWAHQSGGFLED